MKICLVCFIHCIISIEVWPQITLYNLGASITNSSSDIFIHGNYVNRYTASIVNGGNLYLSGDLTNTANNHLFVTNAGKVILNGTQPQHIDGDSVTYFYKLEMNNTGHELVLNQTIQVKDTLSLINGNIHLNGHNINLGSLGYLMGEDNFSRVYGNSGLITASRLINHTNTSENIAGIGMYLSTKENFGMSNFQRGHAQQFFTGDSSLLRYYNFNPSYAGHIDTLLIYYLENEMIGEKVTYKIFSSTDIGTTWHANGGTVNVNNFYVSSTTVSESNSRIIRFSIFPTENMATCLPDNRNFISAIFLASSTAFNNDSVKFIPLSISQIPFSYYWDFGDGITSTEDSPSHIYRLTDNAIPESYKISMMVTNGICTDTRKKNISIYPVINFPKQESLFNEIEFAGIFPNPTTGMLQVEVKTINVADITIELKNIQGIQMDLRTIHSSNKDIIDYSFLSPGVYYMTIHLGENIQVLKMVKL